ncbi:hypothetical protein [Rhizobium sp. LC145]|jgi:hypothetical protein|uniref:hypothetical protein n=1 Tax=Rhizobium sp. LC145 TaxID=1120688 RepID=UPI00062A0B40|nr:hypothetical protein [Rhizobium sp. LC145]KKX33139.1 hypothetical protein YH62_06305 [Rhizobium sp. LC145]
MHGNKHLANAARALSLSDREIAHRLGLSVAVLRSVDGAASPEYLRLALAALVVGLDPDVVLKSDAVPSLPVQKGREPIGHQSLNIPSGSQ